jgi:hypothetical protein
LSHYRDLLACASCLFAVNLCPASPNGGSRAAGTLLGEQWRRPRQRMVMIMIDSITLLTKYKFSESDIKFMEYVQGLEKAVKDIKITVYQDSNEDTNLIITISFHGSETMAIGVAQKLYFVFELVPNQQRTICVGDLDSWKDILEYWNSSKYPYIKWTDVKVDENKFVRNVGNIIYHIDNGEIAYCEKNYNFSDMMPLSHYR